MKKTHAEAHMAAAHAYAKLSHCVRKKVGCIFVKNNNVISIGVNGTPPGECNICELPDGSTKPSVYHAEKNAIKKLIQGTESVVGASVFVTLSPCYECATLMTDVGIEAVYYHEEYKNTDGIDFLRSRNVTVEQI